LTRLKSNRSHESTEKLSTHAEGDSDGIGVEYYREVRSLGKWFKWRSWSEPMFGRSADEEALYR
jgi:hypothetical protein